MDAGLSDEPKLLRKGLIVPDEVDKLFKIFFEKLNVCGPPPFLHVPPAEPHFSPPIGHGEHPRPGTAYADHDLCTLSFVVYCRCVWHIFLPHPPAETLVQCARCPQDSTLQERSSIVSQCTSQCNRPRLRLWTARKASSFVKLSSCSRYGVFPRSNMKRIERGCI